MRKFYSPLGNVELTDERLNHILTFHPEIKTYQKYFTKALAHPDSIRTSKTDPKVYIFYRRIKPRAKYLAIVTKTNERNFILTAYLTHRIQHPEL